MYLHSLIPMLVVYHRKYSLSSELTDQLYYNIPLLEMKGQGVGDLFNWFIYHSFSQKFEISISNSALLVNICEGNSTDDNYFFYLNKYTKVLILKLTCHDEKSKILSSSQMVWKT